MVTRPRAQRLSLRRRATTRELIATKTRSPEKAICILRGEIAGALQRCASTWCKPAGSPQLNSCESKAPRSGHSGGNTYRTPTPRRGLDQSAKLVRESAEFITTGPRTPNVGSERGPLSPSSCNHRARRHASLPRTPNVGREPGPLSPSSSNHRARRHASLPATATPQTARTYRTARRGLDRNAKLVRESAKFITTGPRTPNVGSEPGPLAPTSCNLRARRHACSHGARPLPTSAVSEAHPRPHLPAIAHADTPCSHGARPLPTSAVSEARSRPHLPAIAHAETLAPAHQRRH